MDIKIELKSFCTDTTVEDYGLTTLKYMSINRLFTGVQQVLSAKDMSSSDVEHLGVMAWASQFRNVPPRPPVHDMLRVALDSTSGRVGEPVSKLNGIKE